MNLHRHARLTLRSRADLVEAVTKQGLTLKLAPARFRVSERAAAKWLGRFRREGLAGLQDRSSRPHHHPRPPRERRWPCCARCVFRSFRLPSIAICHGPSSRASSPTTAWPSSQTWTLRHRPSATNARTPRRPSPYRHQKARPQRVPRSPRHRQQARSLPRRRLGVRPCGHR
jgi:hypothetical protein